MILMPISRIAAITALLAVGLGACGSAPTAAPDSKLAMVASFYPLQYVAMRIGGDQASVTNLTKPGGEPHDLELTPQDVAGLLDADLVVYLKGFQPAVDAGISGEAAGKAFDASAPADLDLSDPDAAGASDPHFWLDPVRLQAVADALAARMSQADPAAAGVFAANLAALSRDLRALDHDLRAGLANCASKDLVTSHTAFGYLARRYGLRQVGITGLTPDAEPSTGQLAALARFVRDRKVRTIYSETLVSPAVANTLARETGAATAVLDPLEGLNDRSAGADYLAVMRANLATLRKGQPCP